MSNQIKNNAPSLTFSRISKIFEATDYTKKTITNKKSKELFIQSRINIATNEGIWTRFKTFVLKIIYGPCSSTIKEKESLKKDTVEKVLNKIEHLKLAAPRLLFSKNRDLKREFNFLVKEINTLINNPDMRFACRVQVDRISDYNLDKSRCIKESQVKFYIINTKTGMVESESE